MRKVVEVLCLTLWLLLDWSSWHCLFLQHVYFPLLWSRLYLISVQFDGGVPHLRFLKNILFGLILHALINISHRHAFIMDYGHSCFLLVIRMRTTDTKQNIKLYDNEQLMNADPNIQTHYLCDTQIYSPEQTAHKHSHTIIKNESVSVFAGQTGTCVLTAGSAAR